MGKKTALITGATGGLGTEFAKIHASKGGNLVLVARNEDRLDKLKKELQDKYKIEVFTIIVDLSQMDAAETIFNQVIKSEIQVDYLINNAGFGGRGEFHNRTMEQDISMLSVNVITVTKLLKLFLPEFVKRGKGSILNVSSTASLMPGPLQAEYYATKAYVTSLGNAIWQEIQGTGVTLTTLMPGAMDTGFIKASDMGNTQLFAHPVSPIDVAKAGYEGMLSGKINVLSGLVGWQKVFMKLTPFVPRKLMLKSVYNMQKQK